MLNNMQTLYIEVGEKFLHSEVFDREQHLDDDGLARKVVVSADQGGHIEKQLFSERKSLKFILLKGAASRTQ